MLKKVIEDLDRDTLLLLFGLFIVIEGITAAGVIDAIAGLFNKVAGDSPFLLYVILVVASVILSAFIDNIPYVATVLPVVQSIAMLMNVEPEVFYFGLLIGATLGGNLTPIGASAIRKHCRYRYPEEEWSRSIYRRFPPYRRTLYSHRSSCRICLYLAGLGNMMNQETKKATYESTWLFI